MLEIVATLNETSFAGDAPPRRVPLMKTVSSTSYPVPPVAIATPVTLPDPSVVTLNVAPEPSIVDVDATPETVVDGVMIIPADMPYLNSKDLINLEKKFIELNCEKVVMPEYNSRIGNPVILPRNYFNTLKSLKDDFGARSLIRKKDIITLKTGFGTIFDIDTKEELAKTKVNY